MKIDEDQITSLCTTMTVKESELSNAVGELSHLVAHKAPGRCMQNSKEPVRQDSTHNHVTTDSFVSVKRHHPSYFTNVILNFIGFIVLLMSIYKLLWVLYLCKSYKHKTLYVALYSYILR